MSKETALNESNTKLHSFVSLISANQRRLYGFIRALVINPADADDLLQEVSAFLWERFDEFEPGTDFAAWALAVARFRILSYREARRREIQLGDEAFDLVAREIVHQGGLADARIDALRRCMRKLSPDDRQLLEHHYQSGTAVKEIALETSRSPQTVYRKLNEIRIALLKCIRATLALD